MPPVFGPWSCRGERDRALAIGQRKEADLASGKILFDHHFGAGGPERAVEHHGYGGFGFRQGHRHDHALAGRQPIGLDHDRRPLAADIGQRVGGVGEAAIGAGRNTEFGAQRLGKPLGAFKLGSLPARPERLDAGVREIVDDAGRQRRFRADHHEIHLVGSAETNHRGMVGDVQRHAFGFPRGAGIARRAP
jgi:hypothetical protein